MVAVTVYDILLRVPKGAEARWPQDAAKLGRMAFMVLKEREGERAMGMWVGLSEANAMIRPLAKLTVSGSAYPKAMVWHCIWLRLPPPVR